MSTPPDKPSGACPLCGQPTAGVDPTAEFARIFAVGPLHALDPQAVADALRGSAVPAHARLQDWRDWIDRLEAALDARD